MTFPASKSGSTVFSSPTFTSTSIMSSDELSEPRSRSSTLSTQGFSLINDDSDDEVVWDISSEYRSSDDLSTESSVGSEDDDFVVLSRPRTPPARGDVSTPSPPQHRDIPSLASNLARLSLNTSVSVKKNVASPSVDDSPSMTPVKTRAPRRSRKRKAKKEARAVGLGSRPIVDDVSESGDGSTDCEHEVSEPSMYEEAVKYVTSFLQNPSAYGASSSRLTLLQSLIIELGLSSSSLPGSLKSAKAVIKSQAFLNIREYLAVRDKGRDALKQVMYPSRSALIKSIRKQPRNRASLNWVKEHGLQVLLVTAYHH